MMKGILITISLGVMLLLSCSTDEEQPLQEISEEQQETDTEEEEEVEETVSLEQPISSVDYGVLTNWAFHPDQSVSLLSDYDLDIAVVNKDLELTETVAIENNSKVNTGVDVFFVHPTVLTTNPETPEVVEIGDQPAFIIASTILAQGGLLAKYGRVFAPRYRQSSAVTYTEATSKLDQAETVLKSYSDVKAAFMSYLDNHNNGNKIILAGHSQGSFLLAMLLRDVFDEDANLRSKLVTAALGGMGVVYADDSEYKGGQFQNIPLCTQTNQCGCIQNWQTWSDGQTYPDTNMGIPAFNTELVKYGVVNRTIDLENDWFVQDNSYIAETEISFRYIVLGNNANANFGYNFVAHDDLYTARFRRDGKTKLGLNVAYVPQSGDQRINDLDGQEDHFLYDLWGYHQKDYAIYVWPLIQQIDEKLANCN